MNFFLKFLNEIAINDFSTKSKKYKCIGKRGVFIWNLIKQLTKLQNLYMY